jgi:predicted secreted protein
VRLPADRPGGYIWIPLGGVLPVMSTDGVPEYEPDAAAPDTAPGTDVWRFVGRDAGHAHIVFEYRRPGDPDAAPERTVTYHFDVE